MAASFRWVITGAGGGLGQALVREALASPGTTFVAALSSSLDNSSASLQFSSEALQSGRLQMYRCNYLEPDLTIQDNLVNLLRGSTPVFLIHNAGMLITHPKGSWDESAARQMWEVNFWGPLRLTYALLPALPSGSHIVNIGSMGGFQGSVKFPGLALYSASKAALACWTECMATELQPRGIRVNCLALGSVDTPMLRKAFPGYQSPVSPAAMAQFIIQFAIQGAALFNGKVIPVAVTTP
ncbi:MAG: SDR family oxidoreductase [Flavobacteriales bacterium]|nr:SDR family oxidoreductase [Flavobacteriales bacterium]MCX7767883.1 SDR family oxidoreductase [Flavobacteriales bacterium]MDW8409287.1 SDR family oxidoreductase [Flavobacteriales bacterium]